MFEFTMVPARLVALSCGSFEGGLAPGGAALRTIGIYMGLCIAVVVVAASLRQSSVSGGVQKWLRRGSVGVIGLYGLYISIGSALPTEAVFRLMTGTRLDRDETCFAPWSAADLVLPVSAIALIWFGLAYMSERLNTNTQS